MKINRVTIAALAVGIVGGALAASERTPAGEPAVEEVVARSVAARGGLDAWRKVETMVWVGHIESAHAPAPSLPFRLEQQRPNKTRLQVEAPGDKSIRVFDGVQGWKLHSVGGRPQVQPYAPQEAKFAEGGHGIDGPLLDAASRGSGVSLEGLDELEGHKAYHLRLHPAEGQPEDVWVDAETYLEVRHDRLVDGPGGATRRVATTFGDYRTVEGLKVPFLITTGGEKGTSPDKLQIEQVVLNAPLDESTFANPSARHGRQRGRLGAMPRSAGAAPDPVASTAGRGPPGAAQP
jgi:hypothetical protein